jgi:hypothetical protein
VGVRLALLGLVFVACSAPAPEVLGLAQEAATWDAGLYCRSTTCPVPDGWPQGRSCQPPGWSETCAKADKPRVNVPLWWRSSCVGVSLNERSGRKVSYEAASEAVHQAFWQWTTAICGPSGGPSIDWRDMGPVSCNRATYDKKGPNQNVIVFQDDAWPHDEKTAGRTLALTTVTFDVDTGEIFDADMELNTRTHDIRVGGEHDLQSVITHEAGHFLGLAHSSDEHAVMYGEDDGTTKKRTLTRSDILGICAIYRPDGVRSVSALVDPSGVVPASACDPTPRRGLTSACP